MTPHEQGVEGRDELWKLRAERAESLVERLQARLRSIQGEIKAPDVILWRCPGEGCGHYTFGPDWRCPVHVDSEPVPVRMVQVGPPDEAAVERAARALTTFGYEHPWTAKQIARACLSAAGRTEPQEGP